MPDLLKTDRYRPDRNGVTQCMFCDQASDQGRNSREIGRCARHSAIFQEDMAGKFQQNRLKILIDAYNLEQSNGKQ